MKYGPEDNLVTNNNRSDIQTNKYKQQNITSEYCTNPRNVRSMYTRVHHRYGTL